MAQALGARGAHLTLGDVSAAPLAALARELGPGVATKAVDITREAEADALMTQAAERFGRVDSVINTAGLLRIAPALELDTDDFKQTLDVNVTGALLLSRAAARAMQDKGGRIVHFASVSSVVADINYAAYATSKAALSQLVRVLAREWAATGITVNAIGPAMTETGMTGGYLSDGSFRNQALASIPLGRFGTPEDLIGPLVLLLSPAGAFITGQTIYVDGGRTLV
jgi:NAD(P)-dependent dehydrogenase (short-subunit alcohol dehydrogenase family)